MQESGLRLLPSGAGHRIWYHQVNKSMQAKPRTPEETYGPALAKALDALPVLDPQAVAAKAALDYQSGAGVTGHFQVQFLGKMYLIGWPGGEVKGAADGEDADIATRILLLHYLLTADGTPMAGKWMAFRNLPGGLGYDDAFRGRASWRLARAFGQDREAFEASARLLGGEQLTFGDVSFMFRALPRVWLAVILHLADEEFPAEANVLFDATTDHYLPTEDVAVLGGMLAGRLIKAARSR